MASHADIASDFVRATTAVRRLFHRLATEWNGLHRDIGVSARMRAILEYLNKHGPVAVPGIAREKEVSRQHVQVIVNELLEAGLVQRRTNPAHASSYLIAITPKGRRVFDRLKQRETDLVPLLSRSLKHLPLGETADALEALIAFFDSEQWRTIAQSINPDFKETSDE